MHYETRSAGWVGAGFTYDNFSTTAIETGNLSNLSQLAFGLKGGVSQIKFEVVDQSGRKAVLQLSAQKAELSLNGGFEAAAASPWQIEGFAGIDRGAGFAHSGQNNGWVRTNGNWAGLSQAFTVAANTNYRVTAWLRTSANNGAGYMGVRGSAGLLTDRRFCSLSGPAFTQYSVTFNSGSNTSVVPYVGTWGVSGDTWVQIDDVTITRE